MANEPFVLKDAESAGNLQKMWRYVRGMMRTKIPGGRNTADGPVFPEIQPSRGVVSIPPRSFLLRVAATLDGQGKYDAYVQMIGTNTASLGATNNVALSSLLTDGERVVFWNTTETAASATSPAGTNRTHTFSTGQYIPADPANTFEASGTNTLRVFWNFNPSSTGGFPGVLLYVAGQVSGEPGHYWVHECGRPPNGVAWDINAGFKVGNSDAAAWTYNSSTNGASLALNTFEINGAGSPLDLGGTPPEDRCFWAVRAGSTDESDGGGTRPFYFMFGVQFEDPC